MFKNSWFLPHDGFIPIVAYDDNDLPYETWIYDYGRDQRPIEERRKDPRVKHLYKKRKSTKNKK